MKNDYLIERKETFFSKVVNFIKGLFNKKEVTIEDGTNNIEPSTAENNEFLDYVKIGNTADKKLLELQSKFDKKEVLMADLSDEELISLKDLYISQIESLNKEIDNKKTKIGMLRFRLTGSVNKI